MSSVKCKKKDGDKEEIIFSFQFVSGNYWTAGTRYVHFGMDIIMNIPTNYAWNIILSKYYTHENPKTFWGYNR
jgi:hypothetical protein